MIKQKHLVQQLVQGLNYLKDKTRPRPAELDKLMYQLIDDQIEILNSFQDRQVAAWIWFRSKIAFESLRSLDEHHGLVKLLSCLAKAQQSAKAKTYETIQQRDIDIDIDQFKKAIFLFPTVVNHTADVDLAAEEYVMGVTKLRNKIYALCRSFSSANVIRVFEDTEPFHHQGKIELNDIKCPEDVVSSEKENCLYLIDIGTKYIWEIARETVNYNRVTKWLSIDIDWSPNLSVSRDGHLLIVRGSGPLSRLEIYGADSNLRLSIYLPQDIQFPQHAVETSTGNFVILHERIEEKEIGSSGICQQIWKIWEVTRNGKMVIRRFISQDIEQELKPRYLLIDSDDRIFAADPARRRVILLDSDLRWNGILIEEKRRQPLKLCYSDDKKRLFVLYEFRRFGFSVYSFK